MYKSSGLIIENRKVLASRSKGKSFFIQPGGKVEIGETSVEALVREMQEEQQIIVDDSNLTFLGTFSAIAAGHEKEKLQVHVNAYIVHTYKGEICPSSEIVENRWVDSHDIGIINLG